MIFGVRIQQFIHEVRDRRQLRRVQIQHPRLQMRRLERDGFSESPQRRAGQFPATLPLQDLRATGHKPDAFLGCPVGVGHALRERQCARSGLSHVFRDFPGRGPRPVTVQGGQVHHAAERLIPGQVLHQGSPGLPLLHLHGFLDDTGVRCYRPPVFRRFAACQDDRLVTGRKAGCQFRRQTAAVPRQNPHAARLFHFRRPLRHDDALVRRPGGVRFVHSQDFRSRETRVAEGLPPDRGAREGMMRPVAVGEPPPAVQLAERQIHPPQSAEVLERDQLSGRREQITAMSQCLLQVPRGVQHVGCDDQVITVGGIALRDGVLFDVQSAVLDASASVAEARLRFRKEARGDVRVRVVEPAFREFRQDVGGRRPRARADLHHPQLAVVRHPGHQRPDRVAQHLVGGSGHRRFQIQIGRGRVSTAEQERQRVHAAEQRFGQGAATPPEQPDFGHAVGVLLRHRRRERLKVFRHLFRQRVPVSRDYHEAVAVRHQHAGPGEHFEHPAEQAPVLRNDVQPLPQIIGVHGLSRPPLPPEFFQGRERAGS